MEEKLVKTRPFTVALGINIFYLLLLVVLFRPHFYYDDFLMACRSYGVYTGQYLYETTYMHYMYGRLIQGLMEVWGGIPWYTVLFFLWIFIALVIFSYTYLKNNNNFFGGVIVNLFIVFFAYEGYIDLTFTKVAGLIGAIGVFLVIYKQSSMLIRCSGCILFLGACLIRYAMAQMVIYGFVLLCFFECIKIFFWGEKTQIKRYAISIIVLLIVFLGVAHLPVAFSKEEKDAWVQWGEYNDIRSGIQDYDVPDYQENIAFFHDIDVTENDIYIYRAWNADVDKISQKTGDKIYDLQRQQGLLFGVTLKELFTPSNVCEFFKVFPLQILNIDVFIVYLLVIVMICMLVNISTFDKMYHIFNSFIVLMGINYYMYIGNRYLQHRVDIGVIAVAILSMLLFLGEEKFDITEDRKKRRLVIAITLFMLFSGQYHLTSELSTESIKQNRAFFEETSITNNIYLFVGQREGGNINITTFFEAFDVPKVGLWKNIFFENSYYEKRRFKQYGISNIYQSIIDGEKIYMVMENSNNDIEHWEQYLTDNYSNDDVNITPIREFGNKRVCIVTTYSLDDRIKKLKKKDNGDVVSDISCEIADGSVSIIGSAFLKDESGFDEEMYLQYIDAQTGKEQIDNIIIQNDESKDSGQAGSCARILYNHVLPDFYDSDDTINLILVENGNRYTITLKDKENE